MPMVRLRLGRQARLFLGGLFLITCACGDDKVTKQHSTANRPPVITRVGVRAAPVLTHQEVIVYAGVRDPEGDDLAYLWEASNGSFPLGRRSPSVYWRTPDDAGPESLRIRTWDYEDTATASVGVLVETVGPPDSLTATAGTSIADLTWKSSRDQGIEGWVGYEVFYAARPFDSVPSESIAAYRATPEPITATSLRVPGLERGRKYFFRVGSLRGWEGREERSPLTAPADAVARPEWMKQLQELASATGAQGVDLSSGELRRLDPADASIRPGVDLYCGTSDPSDGPGSPEAPAGLQLKSVSRLANRNPEWALRVVKIKLLGSSWEIPPITDDGWSEEVPLLEGAVYAVKTPEGNYAKVLVTGVAGVVWPYRQISLKWAYQTVSGYPRL